MRLDRTRSLTAAALASMALLFGCATGGSGRSDPGRWVLVTPDAAREHTTPAASHAVALGAGDGYGTMVYESYLAYVRPTEVESARLAEVADSADPRE